ncbi:hypothetical protein Taro_007705, partial [Colocasia esculenta]|nr:hypothetical protein [Colocasia esculenta]
MSKGFCRYLTIPRHGVACHKPSPGERTPFHRSGLGPAPLGRANGMSQTSQSFLDFSEQFQGRIFNFLDSRAADRMCRSGAVDLICIDSVSALTPRAEIEGEIGMQQMGLQARLMSQALRKMSGNASKAGCTLIFLNQIRYKIGVVYGNPEVTSGGIALKFFASVRLEIRPVGKIKSTKGDEDIGIRVSRPYKQAEFEIIFGEGVSKL